VDATNPAIFVSSSELRLLEPNLALPSAETYTILETLRRKGAEMMGLDPAQGHPKIAVLSDPQPSSSDSGVDIVIHALSMGILHRAVPLTVGLCLGVAARVPGTLAWDIMSRSRSKRSRQARDGLVRMQHPSGITEVGSEIVGDEVKSATVVRTGKQLMKGVVWW
jgi:2-methylaconitate cis-trans-isomerase PrpF